MGASLCKPGFRQAAQRWARHLSRDIDCRGWYPEDTGQTLDLSADREMSATFADLVMIRQAIAGHQKFEAELKQKIQQRMGEASKALFETGSVTWKRSKDSQGVDLEKLLQAHPDLKTQYALSKPGSRRFLIA